MDCPYCGKPKTNSGTAAIPVWECIDYECPGMYSHKTCPQCKSGPAKVKAKGIGDMEFVCSKGHTYK